MRNTTSVKYASMPAAALLVLSLISVAYAQTSPAIQSNATANSNATALANSTTTANAMDFETARDQYLEAWNQTELHPLFSTFIEPYTEQGYGLYTEHPSDVFQPGDTITYYVEPVGFSHEPVLDEQGNTLYRLNLTASVEIVDEAGSLLATIEDFPPYEAVSHRKNTEMFMTVTVVQDQPFPVGSYMLTYTITDVGTGESFSIIESIRIAETVTT